MQISLAIGAIIAALIGFFGGRLSRNKDSKENSAMLLNALFGELLHAFQHYYLAANELPTSKSTNGNESEITKKLNWAKYGEFKSSNEFQKYGFLSKNEIKDLLQLSFLLRNTDYLIEQYLNDINIVSSADLKNLKNRMLSISNSSKGLLEFIVSKYPEFDLALKSVEKNNK